MHAEVVEFLSSIEVQTLGWVGAKVIEVGAADWNGSARDYFDRWESWEGIDLMPGPGVDHVGDAVALLAGMPADYFDYAVSTEVFEHAPEWRAIVAAMLRVLRPGGYLVATCASPMRPPHSAVGAESLAPGEYYAGVSVVDMLQTVSVCGIPCTVIVAEDLPIPGDTRVLIRRE